jgi:hypothetical protein
MILLEALWRDCNGFSFFRLRIVVGQTALSPQSSSDIWWVADFCDQSVIVSEYALLIEC